MCCSLFGAHRAPQAFFVGSRQDWGSNVISNIFKGVGSALAFSGGIGSLVGIGAGVLPPHVGIIMAVALSILGMVLASSIRCGNGGDDVFVERHPPQPEVVVLPSVSRPVYVDPIYVDPLPRRRVSFIDPPIVSTFSGHAPVGRSGFVGSPPMVERHRVVAPPPPMFERHMMERHHASPMVARMGPPPANHAPVGQRMPSAPMPGGSGHAPVGGRRP